MGFVNWVRTQWDRAAALAAMLIGLLALLLGWLGVSANSYVAKQLPYVVSGALFGIFMIGIAATIWLSADLRDEWRELRGIRIELHAQSVGSVVATSHPGEASEHTQKIPAVPAGNRSNTDLG
jgi:hypothetical protein